MTIQGKDKYKEVTYILLNGKNGYLNNGQLLSYIFSLQPLREQQSNLNIIHIHRR